MFCKWCGLESDTSDACSWCHQPFTTTVSAPAAKQEDTLSPKSAIPSAFKPLPGAVPLGDFGEFDDDLSPVPFTPLASPPVSPPSVPPPTNQKVTPPVPPIVPPTGKGYRPTDVQPVEDRPDLKAIPIKKLGLGGEPPAVIPIQRPQPPPPTTQPVTAGPAPIANEPETFQEPPEIELAPTPVSDPVPIVVPPLPDARAERTPRPMGDVVDDEPQIGAAPIRPATPIDPGTPSTVLRPAASAQPQPLGGGAVTAVRSIGRVYCRWCGMESDTPDVCSWCRKDIRSQSISRPLEALKRGPEPVKKGPQRQEIKPAVPLSPEGNGNGAVVPALGTFTAQKSRYYPDKVYDPVSGAHYDADTGVADAAPQPSDIPENDIEPIYPVNQLAVNIALLIGIAVVGALMLQRQPAWYLSLLGITNFFAGVAMPLLRTVPFGEDDSSDLGMAIGLILILGPLVGGILYFFICFVRQDFSPGIVGVFVSYLLLRFTFDGVLGIPISRIMPWSEFTPETIGAQIIPFVTIAGWYAAGVFHKPDE